MFDLFARLLMLALGQFALLRSAAAGVATHQRFLTHHGAIHVWTPDGYDPDTAALLVYVHGYFANVDDAWRTYRLGDQFAESGVNAMFVACEAPQAPGDDVSWTSYADLVAAVAARVDLPDGKRVVMGHSGAHRTIAEWLDDDSIDTVALLDAGYGPLDAYGTWLDARADRRLIDVGDLTREWTDPFHAALAGTYTIEHFPPAESGELAAKALAARIVYVRSKMGHMPLVTRGIAIPMILRALEVPLVANAHRQDPITPLD
ncbi:MAG: hypothetical protein ABJE66_05915 [Deltaproteobacteria bacterium]